MYSPNVTTLILQLNSVPLESLILLEDFIEWNFHRVRKGGKRLGSGHCYGHCSNRSGYDNLAPPLPAQWVLVLNVYGITRNTHDRGDINMAMLGALGIPGMGQVRVHVKLCVCDKMGSG